MRIGVVQPPVPTLCLMYKSLVAKPAEKFAAVVSGEYCTSIESPTSPLIIYSEYADHPLLLHVVTLSSPVPVLVALYLVVDTQTIFPSS